MNESRTPLHTFPRGQVLALNQAAVREADDPFLATHDGTRCKLCAGGPDVDFSMAFQPIVDIRAAAIIAYEALARGPIGQPASTVLAKTLHNNRYSMDQRCREKAISIATTLGILDTPADLCVNFFPNAVYQPRQCLTRTFAAADAVGFPLARIIFEISEVEKVRSHEHLRNIMTEYRKHGLRVAIDDFGAGHSGLNLLSVFQPDIIKIDRALIQCIHERPASRAIVRSIVQVCADLGINIIAEGIEQQAEMHVLCDMGIHNMQGFLFAEPAFEALPPWPPTNPAAALESC